MPDLQTDILNYLQGHKGLTVEELTQHFHVAEASVLVALYQLKKDECVSCADGVVWALKRDVPE